MNHTDNLLSKCKVSHFPLLVTKLAMAMYPQNMKPGQATGSMRPFYFCPINGKLEEAVRNSKISTLSLSSDPSLPAAPMVSIAQGLEDIREADRL